MYALDNSNDALKIAQKRSVKCGRSFLFESDILKENDWVLNFKNIKFDIIISNPPYVRALEKAEMKPNVLNYEPGSALFVTDEDPLIFIEPSQNWLQII